MINILTADMLKVENLTRTTPALNIQQGRDDYAAGLITITSVAQQTAQFKVRDHRNANISYDVSLWLQSQQVALTCTCRDSTQWYLCRHRLAAFIALHEYLKAHPPKIWQAVLEQAEAAAPRRTAASYGPIVFSLQDRSSSWVVVPYALSARHFAPEQMADRAALALAVDQFKGVSSPKALRSRVSRQAYPHATESEIAAVNLAVGNPYMMSGASYGRENTFYEPVLALLPGCLVYVGEEYDPFGERIEVLAEQGVVEATLRQSTKGMQLSAQVLAGARVLPLRKRAARVVVNEPLWLLLEQTLVQVKSSSAVASALIDYPELTIPTEDQNTFLDQHLLPLTEHVAVRGDMLEWRDVDLDPQLRLYLSESAEGLQAELRFGYGEHELAYDKRLPANGTQRLPGTLVLARITRRPEHEQAAWQALASYGLKRAVEPGVMVLKKTVQPIDFLLHQVPRLAEAGYTIYGEEALASARVNRNKPTISFNVSSGIDWFDVSAVVNYGDLSVGLKELRQAIKKREKYIKLADGTIGALPEEWAERYRHLLALGEDRGDDLRFSPHHITMLDQLLSEADGGAADQEFQRRREKLRSFEHVQPHALPSNFVGELRPYQKFGYDWLHFLREYGFGGCLADDMG
ncbi:MAG: SNF2 helicase associated domain-containing protein, partial [Roseiflexaceae bacterium]